MSEIQTGQDGAQEGGTIAHNIAHNRAAELKREKVVVKYSKTDSRYWRPRVVRNARTIAGQSMEDAHYSIQVMHQGRREWFSTEETDKGEAASKAAQIYRKLILFGWDAAIKEHKPNKVKSAEPKSEKSVIESPTLSDYLRLVEELGGLAPKTFAGYTRMLRLIVAKIANVKGSISRFNARKGGGGEKWHARVDAVRLDAITKEAVHKWRLDFVKRAGAEPTAQVRAKVSCNSIIAQARGLFSKRLVGLARPRVALPSPLPFDGVEKFTKLRSYMRYQSKVNAIAILTAGREELAEQAPERFKILILAVCCGLRRNEIDKLIWSQVDFDAAVIRIQTTRFFKAKSDDSNATVDLEPEIVALMRGWKTQAKSQFVVESDIEPRLEVSYAHYRTAPLLEALNVWLRTKGVEDRKPLHTLRKEFGSIVAEKMGIYAASRALRHADVQVTAMHYVDQKQRIATGLGAVFAPANVTTADFKGAVGAATQDNKLTKKRSQAAK